jgi:hypothetical protein
MAGSSRGPAARGCVKKKKLFEGAKRLSFFFLAIEIAPEEKIVIRYKCTSKSEKLSDTLKVV